MENTSPICGVNYYLMKIQHLKNKIRGHIDFINHSELEISKLELELEQLQLVQSKNMRERFDYTFNNRYNFNHLIFSDKLTEQYTKLQYHPDFKPHFYKVFTLNDNIFCYKILDDGFKGFGKWIIIKEL